MCAEFRSRRLVRSLLIAAVRIYQLCVSPLFPPSCRFVPTCSEYAREALSIHGPIKGLGLALCRFCRCHPFAAGGYDPVPPRVRRDFHQSLENEEQRRKP